MRVHVCMCVRVSVQVMLATDSLASTDASFDSSKVLARLLTKDDVAKAMSELNDVVSSVECTLISTIAAHARTYVLTTL